MTDESFEFDKTVLDADQDTVAAAVPDVLDEHRPGPRAVGSVGRYELAQLLGAGGMGAVYKARDDELGRSVAIKLLLPGQVTEKGRARMVREAQAMAQLNHPNVVPIYDVGIDDGRLFIAMELVDGSDLKRWLELAPRSPREILEMFIGAGEGLLAAHRAGILHRDFKPANVLVDGRGTARITDFGLARALAPVTTTNATDPSASEDYVPSSAALGPLTTGHVVVGTPAYMAPEQFVNRHMDESADQYAFCLSLFEALWGDRPFQGRTLGALASEKRRFTVTIPPRPPGVSRSLLRTLLKGMQPKPDDRHADMETLLSSLRAHARPRRRMWIAAAAFGALAASLAVMTGPAHKRCAADDIATVWSADARAKLQAGFDALEADWSRDAGARTTEALDDYAASWSGGLAEVCDDEGSAELAPHFDQAMECLHDRAVELESVLEVLDPVEADVARRSSDVVDQLRPVADCLDPDALERNKIAAPPLKDRTAAKRIGKVLADARTKSAAGQPHQGLQLAVEAHRQAAELGHPPLVARTNYRLAVLTNAAGDPQQAALVMADTFYQAEEEKMDELAAHAAIELVSLRGFTLSEREAGQRWAREAQAVLVRLDQPPTLQADLADTVGLMLMEHRDLANARKSHERALALRREHGDALDVATSLTNLASVEYHDNAEELAVKYYESALELRRETQGENHPAVALIHHNLGLSYRDLGKPDIARQHFDKALETRITVLGPTHPRVATTLTSLSVLDEAQGDFAQGRDRLARAHQIYLEVYGPDHPKISALENRMGSLAYAASDYDGARLHFSRALDGWERRFGTAHAQTAIAVHNLGLVEEDAGNIEDAFSRFDRAVDIRASVLTADHPKLAKSLAARGRVQVERGQFSAARADLERAFEIGLQDSYGEALSRFALVRSLWPEPTQREHAAEMLADLLATPELDPGLRRQVEQWQARQPTR